MRAPSKYVEDVIPGVDWNSAPAQTPADSDTDIVNQESPAIQLRGDSVYSQTELISNVDAFITRLNPAPATAAPHEQNGALLAEFLTCTDSDRRTELRNRLIENNQGLVHYVANSFASPSNGPASILASEGQSGLINAIENCDPARIATFATYAHIQIRGAIIHHLSVRHEPILPLHAAKRLRLIRRAVSQLVETHGVETPAVGSPADVFTNESIARAAALGPGTVQNLRPHLAGYVSVDAPLGGDDDNSSFQEVVGDDAESPADVIERSDLMEANAADLEQALSRLLPARANIVRMRFGLGRDRAMESKEIAQQLGVTHQRIDYLLAESMQDLRDRLRHMSFLRRVESENQIDRVARARRSGAVATVG